MKLFKKIEWSSLRIPLFLLTLLWLIHLVQWGFSTSFFQLGVYPRKWYGMIGILFMPLIHGSWAHLLANSFSLLLFLIALFFYYKRIAIKVLIFIWLSTGFWVWVFAHNSYHIGASGVIFGLFSFLFLSGLLSRKPNLMAISLLIWFLNAGAIWGVFPGKAGVSWEGHLLGVLAGIVAGFYYFYQNKKQNSKSVWRPDNDFYYRSATRSNKIYYIFIRLKNKKK